MVLDQSGKNGHQSSGRQTIWATDKWATNQPGDSKLGDTFWSTGRQKYRNNWAATMEVWTINDCRAGAIMCSTETV